IILIVSRFSVVRRACSMGPMLSAESSIFTQKKGQALQREVHSWNTVPSQAFVKAVQCLEQRDCSTFPQCCPAGTPAAFRLSITGVAPMRGMGFIIGKVLESSACHCRVTDD